MKELVNHPNHYNNHPSGVEAIEIVEHMTYNIGTAVAYLWRYQDKHKDPTLDLKKAIWHIEREIYRLTNEKKRLKYRVSCINTVPKIEKHFDNFVDAASAAITLANDHITYTFDIDDGEKMIGGYVLNGNGTLQYKTYEGQK